MKKKLSVLLAVLAALFIAASAMAAGNDVSVVVNGDTISFDVPPMIIDGTTMLPVRMALEPLGATFSWNSMFKIVEIRANGKTINLLIDSSFAIVNGEMKVLTKPAVIIDGRTLIPIRFVAEELGYDVYWNDSTKTVTINGVVYDNSSAAGYGNSGGYGIATDYSVVTDPGNESSDFVNRVLELVNEERAKAGIGSLKLDADLSAVAQQHCNDMIARHFFDHINPDGDSPFDRMLNYGIRYMAAGENIAAGQITPEEVVQAWMNSPGHRANILNGAYGKIGIAYAKGGDYKIYWTQCFTN